MAMEPKVLLMDEPFAALDALTRRKMQEELLDLWNDVRFTVLFVTHSIEEAIIVGSRILVLSPHPGQVRAELNSHQFGHAEQGGTEFQRLHHQIHDMLFSEGVEEAAKAEANHG
jgi:NitT/TauT family transport system ATP-binding protein